MDEAEPIDTLLGSQFGNYRLVRLLGRGGFASVYLGENIYINTLVAVKVLHTEIKSNEMERFRFEARTIANLKHPHIVQLIDFGLEHRMPYLVMSYAPHGHLHQLQTSVGAFSLSSVVSYVKQIASALQFAHDHKIIHRDIKPENILLDVHDSLLLSDFGIALIAQTTRQASSRGITGTLAYMAPEQTQGKPVPASDQYALGVTAYELLTGTRPFEGSLAEIIAQHFSAPPPSLREKLPMLPLSVEQVILRSLAKSPEERFPSVSAFARALEEASGLRETQETQQDISTHFYQDDRLTLPAQPFFEGKTSNQASLFNKEEKAEQAHFTNGAYGLGLSSFEATPTAPLPSVPASIGPQVPSLISASLLAQTHSNAPPSSLSVSSTRTEILPVAQNFRQGKRSSKLLIITLICVVIITLCSVLFIRHSASTYLAVQTVHIKQSPTIPTIFGQQPPIANPKSTPKVTSTTVIARGAPTPTAVGNIISTATTVISSPTPLPTATTIPVVIPTATAIPSPTPTSDVCSSFAGYYKFVNKSSGKNLDVLGDALTDSAKIVQYTDNGKIDQQWSFVATSGGYCKIVNRNSGRLINIPGPTTTAATQLIQFYDDGHTNSQWKLVAVGNGSYKIMSLYDGQCIDVSQASVSDNGAVIQFPDNGGSNQQWQLVQV